MAKKRRGERRPTATGDAGRGSEASGPAAGTPAAWVPVVPRWVPAAVFLGLTLWLFRAFVFSDQMLLGNDTLGGGYAARAYFAQALRELGSVPGWAPLILGGTPFLEALSAGDALYPPSLALLLLTEPYRALGWKLVIHVALAGFLMYGWARRIGASRAAALVAGTGYMAAPFLVSLVHPGHDGKLFVTALTPLLFWVVDRHFAAPRLRTFSAIALVVGLIILTTHFQMAYFLFGAVGLYAGFRTWQVGRDVHRRAAAIRFAIFLGASVAGAGVAAVQFLPAVDYVTTSSRRVATTREAAGETSMQWSSSWSLHPEEAMSLVIPEFVGANTGEPGWAENSYWGRNAFKHNSEYIGLVLLLLAAVSFAGGARRGLRLFLAGLGGVALLFALGANTPVWRIFYEVVPGVGLFRAPSQVIFLTGFAVATLAALGVDRLLQSASEADEEAWRRVRLVLGGGAGITGLLVLLAGSGALSSLWTSIFYRGITPSRLAALQAHQAALATGAGVAFVLACLTLAIAWALRGGRTSPAIAVTGLVLLVAADGARIDGPFVQVLDFGAWAAPDGHVRAIEEREGARGLVTAGVEPFRLLSLVSRGQDVKPSMHGIELVGGHHPNDLNRYRQLIGMVGSGDPVNLNNANIRRLLNVRYILWPDYERGPAPAVQPVSQLQFADGRIHSTLLADDGLPRARLVGDAVVRSDDEAVAYMLSGDFDPEREVVLAEAPPTPLSGGPVQGEVTWIERSPDRIRLRTVSDRAALLVVADNWFEAWSATVDGEAVPILRAYHTLRAVPVPPGEHTVEMSYASARVAAGLRISLVLLVLLSAVGLLDLRRARAAREEAS